MHSIIKYFSKIPGKRLPVVLFVLLVFACTKEDKSNCYICTTTYIVTTDQPVPGYPTTTSPEVEICDIEQEQITEYENTTKGSDVAVISGVTYSSSYSTKCVHE
jgi:major membrane immunogen (membrane-anchored lipoprotein)